MREHTMVPLIVITMLKHIAETVRQRRNIDDLVALPASRHS